MEAHSTSWPNTWNEALRKVRRRLSIYNYDSQRSLISLTRDYKVTDSFSYPILATDSLYKLVFDYNSSDGAILGKLWAIVAFFQGGGWLIAKELTLGHQRIVSEHQRRLILDSK